MCFTHCSQARIDICACSRKQEYHLTRPHTTYLRVLHCTNFACKIYPFPGTMYVSRICDDNDDDEHTTENMECSLHFISNFIVINRKALPYK